MLLTRQAEEEALLVPAFFQKLPSGWAGEDLPLFSSALSSGRVLSHNARCVLRSCGHSPRPDFRSLSRWGRFTHVKYCASCSCVRLVMVTDSPKSQWPNRASLISFPGGPSRHTAALPSRRVAARSLQRGGRCGPRCGGLTAQPESGTCRRIRFLWPLQQSTINLEA